MSAADPFIVMLLACCDSGEVRVATAATRPRQVHWGQISGRSQVARRRREQIPAGCISGDSRGCHGPAAARDRISRITGDDVENRALPVGGSKSSRRVDEIGFDRFEVDALPEVDTELAWWGGGVSRGSRAAGRATETRCRCGGERNRKADRSVARGASDGGAETCGEDPDLGAPGRQRLRVLRGITLRPLKPLKPLLTGRAHGFADLSCDLFPDRLL